MQCPQCQQENPPTSKFCLECGTRLSPRCPSCGHELPRTAKFCNECGHRLASSITTPGARFSSPESYTPKHLAERILTSEAALEGERKQVTVLFADLKGSMELLADRDPEEARKILDPVLEHMIEAVHRFEGTVSQVMGDGIMALFGAPLAHEDHAVRACYAALRMQESVKKYAEGVRRAHGVEVQIRIGMNSGEVVVRSVGGDLRTDYTAVGQMTHLAARMEQLAEPGTAVLTSATLALSEDFVQVKSLGPMRVKGLSEAIAVYELVGANPARSRFQAHAARGLTKFVGRTGEVAQLAEALDLARSGRGQVVAVLGEPGVGKSRLFWEFAHSHRTDRCLVIEGASVSYGKATTYLPVIELLRSYFQVEPREDTRRVRERVTGRLFSLDRLLEPALPALLALLDVPVNDESWTRLNPPQRREFTLDAIKRLLLRESQVQPLIVIFEDLHWIDAGIGSGMPRYSSGRLDEAQHLGGRALEFSRRLGNAPRALHLLGAIATHPDRFDAESAAAHYREALALAEPRGMRPLVAHCNLGLTKLYQRTGKCRESEEHLTTATTMYRQMGMAYWLEKASAR